MAHSEQRHPLAFAPPEPEVYIKPDLYYNDRESSVLDATILDPDGAQTPDALQLRRSSLITSNGVVSPSESHAWDQHHGGAMTVDAVLIPPTTGDYSGPGLAGYSGRQPLQTVPEYGPVPPLVWAPQNGVFSPAPNMTYTPHPTAFDRDLPVAGSSMTESSHVGMAPPMQSPSPYVSHPTSGYNAMQQVQTPVSPHDWMGMAQREVETRSRSKRMQSSSPARTTVDLQRRDGVRKKNGRIDIPQERNIQTIDSMLLQETDENIVRELKQQKRLLRNREAALASRQRKKKHTEDLETREKDNTRNLADIQIRLAHATACLNETNYSYRDLLQRFERVSRELQIAEEEKASAAHRHEEEAAKLRKRIRLLTEQLECGTSAAMSAVPSSVGTSDFYAEMEALTVGPYEWDQFNGPHAVSNPAPEPFHTGYGQEPVLDPSRSRLDASTPRPLTIGVPRNTSDTTTEQPVTTSLVFFLLLCGAFVASKAASPGISQLIDVPAEVRAVAPEVLSNLLADPDPSLATASLRSARPWRPDMMPTPTSAGAAPRGRLDRMHGYITAETKAQEADSAFSLTASQYSSISQMDMSPHPSSLSEVNQHYPGPTYQPGQNLAEGLSGIQQTHMRHNNRAEVYTRSLLWGQIPVDVVRQFKDMVREYDGVEIRNPRASAMLVGGGPMRNYAPHHHHHHSTETSMTSMAGDMRNGMYGPMPPASLSRESTMIALDGHSESTQ